MPEGYVAFINTCSPTDLGGVETVIRPWSNAIQEKGRVVKWVFPSTRGQQASTPTPEGVLLDPIPSFKKIPLPDSLVKLGQEWLVNPPERIIVNNPSQFSLPVIGLARTIGLTDRLSIVFHADPYSKAHAQQVETPKAKLRNYGRLLRTIWAIAACSHPDIQTIAVSQYVAERIKQLGISQDPKVCYPSAYHNQDCNHLTPDHNRNTLRAVTVTRVIPEKGLLSFLAPLAQQCRDLNLPISFALIGGAKDGKYMTKVEKSLAGLVEITGPKKGADLCHQYRDADLLLQASPQEGWGLVNTEAFIHGLPVLARAIPAFKEQAHLIGGEFPGTLVNAHDSNTAVREAVSFTQAIVCNPNLLTSLRAKARSAADIFSPARLSFQFAQTVLG